MFINSETDLNCPLDEPFDIKNVTWYTVKANLSETKLEQEEKSIAIKKQIATGIIQPNGLPAGITPEMLGMKAHPQIQQKPTNQMLPQERIRLLKQQQNQQDTFRNEPKSTKQQFYNKFGIRK